MNTDENPDHIHGSVPVASGQRPLQPELSGLAGGGGAVARRQHCCPIRFCMKIHEDQFAQAEVTCVMAVGEHISIFQRYPAHGSSTIQQTNARLGTGPGLCAVALTRPTVERRSHRDSAAGSQRSNSDWFQRRRQTGYRLWNHSWP